MTVTSTHRIGLIVPSSNITIETEVPTLLRRLEPTQSFTFHASRARMRQVNQAELAAMNAEAVRCAVEVSDADVHAIAYACLIALISQGPDYPEQAAGELHAAAANNGAPAPVVTSASALVDGIRALRANSVAIIAPYVAALTAKVIDYLTANGITVTDSVSLEEADNRRVAQLDPAGLPDVARRLDLDGADAIVISACVQMPSLAAIEPVEQQTGLPVLSAATATTHALLRALELPTRVPHAGALLSDTIAAGGAPTQPTPANSHGPRSEPDANPPRAIHPPVRSTR